MDNFSFKKLKLFHKKAKSEGNTPGQSTATTPTESRAVSPAPVSGASGLKPELPFQSAGSEEEDRARDNPPIGAESAAEARTGMGDKQPATGAEAPAMSTKGYGPSANLTGGSSALPRIMVEAPQEESARDTAALSDGNKAHAARIVADIDNTIASLASAQPSSAAIVEGKFTEGSVLGGRVPSAEWTAQPLASDNDKMLTSFEGTPSISMGPAAAAGNSDEKAKTSGLNTAYEGVKETLRVIERVSDVFTPLKSTAAALLVVFEKIDAVMDIQEQFKVLLGKLQGLETMLESHSAGLPQKIQGIQQTRIWVM